MAERRMFAKTIIDSDAFLDMPLSTQALYFHLSMRADDEGFINNPKKTQRVIGATDDDLKLLIAKRFVIAFESGVIVIKHWKIHNWIRAERIHETVYKDEKSQLSIKDNRAYTLCEPIGGQLADTCQTNDGIDKTRLDKTSIDKNSMCKKDIENLFNELWQTYPRKQGKGSVSQKQKEKLFHIGKEEMLRAINRYKQQIESEHTEQKYIKMGSTFFNSGYVDYLDANYEESASCRKESVYPRLT
jgi:hypothetical protein